jgi:hypothetical protein
VAERSWFGAFHVSFSQSASRVVAFFAIFFFWLFHAHKSQPPRSGAMGGDWPSLRADLVRATTSLRGQLDVLKVRVAACDDGACEAMQFILQENVNTS